MTNLFGLTSPCKDCPFRTDIAFFLRDGRRKEIADDLLHDKIFPCHKTTSGEWDEDTGQYASTGDEMQCAGALIVMLKSGEFERNWIFRLAADRWLDMDKVDLGAPVFNSLADFVLFDKNLENLPSGDKHVDLSDKEIAD